MTDSLAWGRFVSAQFRTRVQQLCATLRWSPRLENHASWLMACMAFETGVTFSPAARNPVSSATGLIQFMDSTARGLGTTTAELSCMTAVEQLEYVERYFAPVAPRIASLEDMYMAILWPRGIGRTLDYLLWRTGTREYAANRGLDRDRDGDVDLREATHRVRELLREGRSPSNAWPADAPSPDWVKRVQTSLNNALGKDLLAVSGTMDIATRMAVEDFQRRQGLVVDGIVGPRTSAALGLGAG